MLIYFLLYAVTIAWYEATLSRCQTSNDDSYLENNLGAAFSEIEANSRRPSVHTMFYSYIYPAMARTRTALPQD